MKTIFNQIFKNWKSSLVGLLLIAGNAAVAYVKDHTGSPFNSQYFISLAESVGLAIWLLMKTDVSQALSVFSSQNGIGGEATAILTDTSTNISAEIKGTAVDGVSDIKSNKAAADAQVVPPAYIQTDLPQIPVKQVEEPAQPTASQDQTVNDPLRPNAQGVQLTAADIAVLRAILAKATA